MTRSRLLAASVLLVACAAMLAPIPVAACPYCGPPQLTFCEQFSKADAAVLVKWVGGDMPRQDQPGSTTYEIVEVAKSPNKTLAKGQKVKLDFYRAAKKGSLALLVGSRTKAEAIEWGSPLEVTEASYRYVVEAPALELPQAKRLPYFLKFLEHEDPTVASDAYGEFANASYKDVVALAKELPRDKLRKWIVRSDINSRLGLYGLMLGLCGTDEDAALMERKIADTTEDFRLGIEGIIGGYLMLSGEKGLEFIEKTKLTDKKVPFSETFAAMQAIRVLSTLHNVPISGERLRESLRLLLDRPELADLVINDLARMKDWGLQERLMSIYATGEYDIPTIKRAIIRYMIASTKDVPGGGGEQLPEHAVNGAKYLQQLRERDPKIVGETEKFFFLN